MKVLFERKNQKIEIFNKLLWDLSFNVFNIFSTSATSEQIILGLQLKWNSKKIGRMKTKTK